VGLIVILQVLFFNMGRIFGSGPITSTQLPLCIWESSTVLFAKSGKSGP